MRWRARGCHSTPISASAEWTSHGFQCSYFADCEYIQTRRAAYGSPFVILVHSPISGWSGAPTAAERAEWALDGPADEEDDKPERPRYFNPKQANIIICDEDPYCRARPHPGALIRS